MSIPVLTAVTDRRAEASLVQAFESADHGVTVVRRCADLADLLATAATGTAKAALISPDLRRLDRDALARFAVLRVAVVVLVPADDEDAERRVRQLGVVNLVRLDAGAAEVAAVIAQAVAAVTVGTAPGDLADVSAAFRALPEMDADFDTEPGDVGDVDIPGRVIAVWGPAGAPGRTLVATSLAAELAAAGESTMLVDADVYGGAVAQALGLLDEAPGLAAAARAANNGTLDVPMLSQLAREVGPRLRVLTGIARAERWIELRPAAIENVLALSRRLALHTVVDCGFCLEQDEELSFDTMAPRRNGATLAVLADADVLVAVGAADPISLQRLVRGLSQLAETVPGLTPAVVVNKVRSTLLAGDPEREISAALQRYAGVVPAAFVPFDLKGVDAALMAGRSLTEAAPDSPARLAIRRYALELIDRPAPALRRRLARRGRFAARR